MEMNNLNIIKLNDVSVEDFYEIDERNKRKKRDINQIKRDVKREVDLFFSSIDDDD